MDKKVVQNKKSSTQLFIAGVDEAGRGPLAGPVVAGAVILNPKKPIKGLADSKQLSEKQREHLYEMILKHSLAWAVASASVEEIDDINILRASLLAMRRAVLALPIKPNHVKVDGNICPDIPYSVTAHVDGDVDFPEISAASIVAKVTRDREMVAYDKEYPGYGFASHKGYSTQEHIINLRLLGACPLHRRSFERVRQVLVQPELALEEFE